MKNSSIILCLLLLAVNVSFAQTETFTLEAAKAYALEHNTSVLNAGQDVEIARKQIIEYRGAGLPQVNINGSFSNFINLPVQVIDATFFDPTAPDGTLVDFRAGTDFSSSANLQVNQLLFNGSYIIGLKVANYYANFQGTVAQVTKEDVAYNVIQAYQLASVAKTNIEFIDSMVLITQDLIDKQQNYFDLGLMLQEDMDQLNYSLLSARQSKTQAELQYKNALELLKFSMGYPMGKTIEITDTPDQLMSEQIEEGNIQSNLTYSVMEKQVKLSEYNLKNTNMAYLPSLNAYFQHSYNAYRNEFNFFDTDEKWFSQTSWGLQLNVPIFSGLQRYSKTSQAKIRLLKDQNSLVQMEQTLKFQELQAKNNLLNARTKHELQVENVRLAQSIYQNAVSKEEIGEGNSILVTQKYNQLIIAQSQLVASMIDLLQAQLALDKIYNKIITEPTNN